MINHSFLKRNNTWNTVENSKHSLFTTNAIYAILLIPGINAAHNFLEPHCACIHASRSTPSQINSFILTTPLSLLPLLSCFRRCSSSMEPMISVAIQPSPSSQCSLSSHTHSLWFQSSSKQPHELSRFHYRPFTHLGGLRLPLPLLSLFSFSTRSCSSISKYSSLVILLCVLTKLTLASGDRPLFLFPPDAACGTCNTLCSDCSDSEFDGEWEYE